ncbi:MAG: hypothetical protein LAP86_33650 [Acidobacteriia bacterium]|nr:hypothetical protein [Terriglobia bacterium]
MENTTFADYVIGKIAGEMSAKKRWTLSKQLADTIKADKIEIFRKVEDKTKAKDKGTLLEVLDSN